MHGVGCKCRIGGRTTLRGRVRPKSKEPAAPGPVKVRRTRWVCAFGMLRLEEGCRSHSFTAQFGWFLCLQLSHFPLFFQMLNCCLQPVPNRFFDLALIV